MSIRSTLHRTRSAPTDPPAPGSPPAASAPADPAAPTSAPSGVPRTRTGAAWIGLCAAALTLVVLIVFMLQNTANVEVKFLWMSGSLPLALALLVAGVGVAIVAMVVGTARMTQLRRLFRQRR
jgi:lipopolysaccharide assembly protein A